MRFTVVVLHFVSALLLATAGVLAQDIVINQQGTGDRLALMNDPFFIHFEDNNLFLGDPNGDAPFILATEESRSETAGIYGDGDVVTLWSPGDGAFGVPSTPPSALVYIVDEDGWFDNDGDAYNNGALVSYINNSGLWQASDESRKTNISRLQGGLARIRALNGYTFEFKRTEEEAGKAEGREPARRAGVIAQEIAVAVPEAVESNGDGELFVNYSLLTPVLIEAIKEQQSMIEDLRSRLEMLESGQSTPRRR